MTVEEMKQRKKELGYSNEKLSELSGVPLGTVQKVLAGVTRSPRYETLIALERILKKHTDRIGEALPETSEKRQGVYTVEDYYLIPKERRVELIDGVIYDMASPTAIHQILSTELCNIIRSYISRQKDVLSWLHLWTYSLIVTIKLWCSQMLWSSVTGTRLQENVYMEPRIWQWRYSLILQRKKICM